MGYSVNCACGNRIEVSATQAGTDLPCRCGRRIRVPRLSELRSPAGEPAYEPSPVLIIRLLYGSGSQAVGGDSCAFCYATPVNRVACRIECEKPIIKGEHSWLFWIFLGALAPALALLYSVIKDKPEVVGEATVLDVQISLCCSCQERTPGRHALREALCRNRDFARLFDKFPTAKVSLTRDVRETA
jgi:hypothetical protein